MILHQEVIKFLHAALECSIYVNPADPGLTFSELAEAARRADFLEGEINDSIHHAAARTFGLQNQKIQLDKQQAIMLQIFHVMEEPDYRNVAAFHGVFTVMRQLTREMGIANAHIERPLLIEKVVGDTITENDTQVAIAILILNDILCEKDGIVSFAKGNESYGSPGDNGNLQVIRTGPMRKEARARAYPIIKKLIEERNRPIQLADSRRSEQPIEAGENKSNDEWISAFAALDLLGQDHFTGTRALCKRAHAGLIKARAKRIMSDSQTLDNSEVPTKFWWAEGEAALKQDWNTGDFDTWLEKRFHIRAFGIQFLRSDIESMIVNTEERPLVKEGTVFIGHGGSSAWKTLRDFLKDRLGLHIDEYNVVPTAGISTSDRLEQMLKTASFAFLLMTAEDEQKDGTVRARENVIHEAGLFQGKLGFRKAIILLEEECNEFSNIAGLGQIRFDSKNMEAKFEEIRAVLERENIIPASRSS